MPTRRRVVTLLVAALLGLRPPRGFARAGRRQDDPELPCKLGAPTPNKTTRDRRPAISLPCSPRGGRRVDGVRVTIDGVEISARYDSDTKTVHATPIDDLATGARQIVVIVTFSDGSFVEQPWILTVRGPAPAPPTPTPDQIQTVALLGQIRSDLGLGPVALDARLCDAARRHSRYLRANKLSLSHEQTPGKPQFFGETVELRLAAVGFDGDCVELAVLSDATSRGSLDALLAGPYHRGPLLAPGAMTAGAGRDGAHYCVLCTIPDAESLVVYPADNARDVPARWDGNEIPDPLRLHGNPDGPFGFPISLHRFGARALTLTWASLTDSSGNVVRCFVNAPDGDRELTDTIVLIPAAPLKPKTTYSVEIVADDDGASLSRSWRFTTKPAAEKPGVFSKLPVTKPRVTPSAKRPTVTKKPVR